MKCFLRADYHRQLSPKTLRLPLSVHVAVLNLMLVAGFTTGHTSRPLCANMTSTIERSICISSHAFSGKVVECSRNFSCVRGFLEWTSVGAKGVMGCHGHDSLVQHRRSCSVSLPRGNGRRRVPPICPPATGKSVFVLKEGTQGDEIFS